MGQRSRDLLNKTVSPAVVFSNKQTAAVEAINISKSDIFLSLGNA